MIEKSIYPKTERLNEGYVYITEKLDGANLVIFKLKNTVYYAQRNNIFTIEDIEKYKQKLYKGLYQFILDHNDDLTENLVEEGAICGEWLGMGAIGYPNLNKRFYMFAKANINENFELINIKYNHKLFLYPFTNTKILAENEEDNRIEDFIPNYIEIVPVVTIVDFLPTKEYLDGLYQQYSQKEERKIEGFVIEYANKITKYVRMKNGKLKEHFVWGE